MCRTSSKSSTSGGKSRACKAADLLYKITRRIREGGFAPDRASNHESGDDLQNSSAVLSEQYNETAGEHFTPREVIALMAVNQCWQ